MAALEAPGLRNLEPELLKRSLEVSRLVNTPVGVRGLPCALQHAGRCGSRTSGSQHAACLWAKAGGQDRGPVGLSPPWAVTPALISAPNAPAHCLES